MLTAPRHRLLMLLAGRIAERLAGIAEDPAEAAAARLSEGTYGTCIIARIPLAQMLRPGRFERLT